MNDLPVFDQNGFNLLDHNDSKGIKSSYITLLQEKALKQYLPAVPDSDGVAVDLGCGYGRLCSILDQLGWDCIGIDPDSELLDKAAEIAPGIEFRVGGVPNLPLEHQESDLILIQSVIRGLLLMGIHEDIRGIGHHVKPGGHIAVVENISSSGKSQFVEESWLVETICNEGFELERRIPIRSGRWWLLYLIRYGLIPKAWLPKIADYELGKWSKRANAQSRYYLNVLFLFRKKE